MKITKQQLKQIIKEEIEIALNEMEVSGGWLSGTKDTQRPRSTPHRFGGTGKIRMQDPSGEMVAKEYAPKHVPMSPEERAETPAVELALHDIKGAMEDSTADSSAMHLLMLQTVERMAEVYLPFDKTDTPLPPAIAKMIELAIADDNAAIRSNFNRLWSKLIQYHRNKGLPLQPRVSHNFRTIDTIVRNM